MLKNKVGIAILVGIVLRILLAITTYHPDLSVFAFAGKLIITDGHWLNFYNHGVQYINGVATLFPHGMVLNYQPLAYLLPSLFYLPFFVVLKQTAESIINSHWNSGFTFYLPFLIYKLPMILADIAIIFLLPKIFTSLKQQKMAQIIWSLNPIAIYVSSMVGQVDIIITFFLVLSLISLSNTKFNRAVVYLALSALIKPAALILIPLVSLYLFIRKGFKQAVVNLFVGIGVYLAGILPFVSSPVYRHYALFADQITKSIYASISIASGHDIPWFLISYLTVVVALYYQKINLKAALAAALFSSLAFTHFHPQWLVWLTPWFIYYTIKDNQLLPLFATLFSWLIIVFSFDSSLNVGLFFGSNLFRFYSPSLFVALARAWLLAYLFSFFYVHGKIKKN